MTGVSDRAVYDFPAVLHDAAVSHDTGRVRGMGIARSGDKVGYTILTRAGGASMRTDETSFFAGHELGTAGAETGSRAAC